VTGAFSTFGVDSVVSDRATRGVASRLFFGDSAVDSARLVDDDFFCRLFVRVGGADVVSESVVACGFSDSAVCWFSDAGLDADPEDSVEVALDVDEDFDDADDESVPDAPDDSDGSAEATPCPVKTAAPIPSATANPPSRPM
jgi:hypothetical protein